MSHLSTEQRQRLRELLETHRRQLRTDIRDELLRKDSEQYGELAGQVHDAGEESVADMLVEINAVVLSQSIRALREVEATLARLDGEQYGCCIDCDEPIPFARLEASPTTQRCVKHQEAFELAAERAQ
jgi:RNA polymerase-binding transcription factor DksA